MKNNTPTTILSTVWRTAKHNLFLILFLALLGTGGLAQTMPPALDRSFTAGVSGGGERVAAIALQPDGKILVGGDFDFARGVARRALARFDSAGNLDESFNPHLPANAVVDFILAEPDGHILISASLTNFQFYGVRRLNPDGSFDQTFNANLAAGYYSANELKLQPDGKIVGAGYSYFNRRVRPVFRLNADGTPDANFNSPLDYVNDFRSVTVQTDGKLLVGGVVSIGGASRGGLIRLNADGSVDLSFNPNGTGTDSDVLETFELPTGKIYAAGYINFYNGTARRGIVRLNPDGTLDQSFDANAIYCSNIASFIVQPDGKLIITDSTGFGGSNATNSNLIVRLKTDGGFDSSFISGFAPGTSTQINRLLLQPDGAVLIGGSFSAYGGAARQNLLRLQSPTSPARGEAAFDFDGDGRSDVGVFRPSNGTWYLQNSTIGFAARQFGLADDRPVPADYDGDGKTDVAVWRAGFWYLQRSSLGFAAVQFGQTGDIPQPADFDADGKAELAVFRPSNGVWYRLNLANNQFTAVQFGQSGDIPVAADYDADGRCDYAVYRPSNGVWYLLQTTKGFGSVQFGISTDKPVVGDYDADGKADEAVYRAETGTWYLLQSKQGFAAVQFGLPDDVPVPADYDGDGKTDIGVFRNGTWYLRQSAAGFRAVQFGMIGDLPARSNLTR